MKELSRLMIKHEGLKDKCTNAQISVKENLKERIASRMCDKDRSLNITA